MIFQRFYASLQLALLALVIYAPFVEGRFSACSSIESFMLGILQLGMVGGFSFAVFLLITQFAPDDVITEFNFR